YFDDAPPLLARVALDRRETAMIAGLLDGDADGEGAPAEVRGLVGQELERVERAIPGIAPVGLVTLPAGNREHVWSHARGDPHRRAHGAVLRLEQQDVPIGELRLRRGLRMHL